MDLADKIVVHKRGTANADPLDRVKQAASVVRSRLNEAERLRTGVPIDNKGPDAGAYHATLEINDFPRAFPSPCFFYLNCHSSNGCIKCRKSSLGRHEPY